MFKCLFDEPNMGTEGSVEEFEIKFTYTLTAVQFSTNNIHLLPSNSNKDSFEVWLFLFVWRIAKLLSFY